jgi:pyruvate/2-oxoglutarate dehydrogenase complex dihydrolipoamide dehydrogenase (E3) component
VLAKAARLLRDTRQFADYGLMMDSPTVDFERVMARVQQVVYTIHEKKQLIRHLQDSGVTVYSETGSAVFVDANTLRLEDDTRLEADAFILCTGGRARRIDFPGAEYALTHSDVWSLKTLPKRLAIIGASATGCQLAAIFNGFGVEVNLLELAPSILRTEDELVGQTIHRAFIDRGVHLTTGISGIDKLEKHDKGLVLTYQDQGQTKTLTADAVVLAVGWPGNVEALNLPAAGVEATSRGYIPVDDYLRTNVPHIFAAGDITGRMMLVQSASYDARIAAENAALGVGMPYQHKLVPHGGFTDPEYAGVGLTETQARAAHDCVVAIVPYSELDRAVIDGHTEGFLKMIVDRDTHRVLGAHIVGEQAVEIVQFIAAGMMANTWVEQIAEIEIAYPTFVAIVGLAARRIVRDLGVMPLTAEWQVLGRRPITEWERRDTIT